MTEIVGSVNVLAVVQAPTSPAVPAAVRAAAEAGATTVMVAVTGNRTRVATLPFEFADFDSGRPAAMAGVVAADVDALVGVASAHGIDIVASIADPDSLLVARRVPAAALHLPAASLLDLSLIAAAAREGVPLWIDTAMAALDEVAEAVAAAVKAGASALLLHGLATTPGRPDELNLRALVSLRQRFGLPVGWYAREAAPALVPAAVALGATVVAVPFDPGGRHGFDAAALRQLRTDAALVARALGDGDKRVQPSEWAARDRAHPSLVARIAIGRGCTVTADMLVSAPPGLGLKPRAAGAIVGRRAVVDIPAGILITLGMLE